MICKFVDVNGTIQAIIDKSDQREYSGKWDKDELSYAIIDPTEDEHAKDSLDEITKLSFGAWQKHIPINFIKVTVNDKPDITIKFENDPDSDDILKDGPTILAYAYFPDGQNEGKIVFNDFTYSWGTTDKYVNHVHIWDAVNVLTHELGHTLGLTHDETESTKDVMDPIYDKDANKLSENDIKRIISKYGKRAKPSDTFAIYPFEESRLNEVDKRMLPYLKDWKAIYTYNDNQVIIPGTWGSEFTVDRYFRVIKSPDDPNPGEAENEIGVRIEGGWHPFDTEVIINLFIVGTNVLDGTAKVSAEILKPSGATIKLYHDDVLITNFTEKSWWYTKKLDKVWVEKL